MTESEAVTLAQSLFSNATNMYVIFLTLVSSYLIVAHLVGKTLTTSQLAIITGLYLTSIIYTLYAWNGFTQTALHYQGIAAELRGGYDYSDRVVNAIPGIVINSFITAATLKYMWDVRH